MIKKTLIASGILMVLVAAVLIILWNFSARIVCGDDQFIKYQSPDEKHEIVNYRRNCGATTTYVYNVELDGKTILRYTYGGTVFIKWIDARNVTIDMASSTPYMKIYKILENYKNIQINFGENIKNSYTVTR